jgi:hypothetical protein
VVEYSAISPEQYQVANQRSEARVVEVVELEDNEALTEAIFFSEEAQGLYNFFPKPSSASATEWQEERRCAVVEDILEGNSTDSNCQGSRKFCDNSPDRTPNML